MGRFNGFGAFYTVSAFRICLRCFMPRILGWKPFQLLLWLSKSGFVNSGIQAAQLFDLL